MNTEKRIANEKYFLQMIKWKTKFYTWKDTGNVYDCSSGRSMKAKSIEGFLDLCKIVRKDFMLLFVELPFQDIDPIQSKIWKETILSTIEF